MTLLLVLTDIASLMLAGMIALGAHVLLDQFHDVWAQFDLLALPSGFQPGDYLKLSPLIVLFLGIYAWRGLIPAIGLNPVEELRRLSISTSIIALALASLAYITKSPVNYSRIVFGLTWILALLLVPLGRKILRVVASRAGLWGEPVAIIGYGTKGRWIADYLLKNPTLGLRPIVALNCTNLESKESPSIPIIQIGTLPRLEKALNRARANTAILVISEVTEKLADELVEPRKNGFQRLITISDVGQMGSLWVRPLDLGGVLGLELKKNLLSKWQRMLKRSLDIVLILVGSVVILPLCLVIALLIWLESRGSIFYGHIRLGKNGREFKVWKFRTMVPDADQVLLKYLDESPDLRAEWEVNFKLKDDPRVTKFGKFLRKVSLDEFPQLWNVLKGEMSLVGPRPIVAEEAARYETGYRKYRSVRPGITGLWQVSGRNDVDYGFRVMLDDYYVRNWSIWLDIHVLISTPWVVLASRGAY